jgi:glutamine amidotransferase
MCRLVAYLGAAQSPAPLVFGGDHSLYAQSWQPRELLSGSVNADGYGVVWYHEGRPRRIAEARPIWHDRDLEGILDAVESTCILAALRNATPGQPVDRAGLLPLVHDRFSFVLNGFVPDFHDEHMRALRSALPDDLYAALRGGSDAETLFLLAVARVREGAGLSEALEATARMVHARVGASEAQLNMVLADGESIGVLRSSTVLLTNSLYASSGVSFAEGGVVLASEALDSAAAWSPVDGHHRVDVRADGLSEPELVFF